MGILLLVFIIGCLGVGVQEHRAREAQIRMAKMMEEDRRKRK